MGKLPNKVQDETWINWFKTQWNKFECWVYSWLPGYKTKIITAMGTIGMASGVLQEYITGLPLENLVASKTLALVSAGLFTLSFWFKGMGDRVKAREED